MIFISTANPFLYGHCTCMGGPAEVYKHETAILSILFRKEMSVKIRDLKIVTEKAV